MKIWGVASRSSRSQQSGASTAATDGIEPPPVPVPGGPAAMREGLSTAGLRVLARLRREVPVDLRLNNEDLRSAADVAEVVEACAASVIRLGVPPPKTLALGPWGQEACAAVTAGDSETPEAAMEAFIRLSPTWASWPLRSISIVELRGASERAGSLGAALRPSSMRVLRLQHLSLRSAIGPLLQAFCSGGPRRLEILDLSGNGLTDEDFGHLLSLTSPEEGRRAALELEGLVLSGNVSLGYASWQRLVAADPLRMSLRLLDLSECSVGAAGAQLLAHLLEDSSLRDLCLYRAGVDAAGVLRLVAAATSLRSLDVTANAQHMDSWMQAVGRPLAVALAATPLKVLTLSCSEKLMQEAAQLYEGLSTKVIIVPNEQNNYNRMMFLGHDD